MVRFLTQKKIKNQKIDFHSFQNIVQFFFLILHSVKDKGTVGWAVERPPWEWGQEGPGREGREGGLP